jgi:hypothetical protein
MTLKKTDKALMELASRQRTLNVKERALLLLADGVTPAQTLLAHVRSTEDVLARLVSEGFLAVCRARSCVPAVSTTNTSQRPDVPAQRQRKPPTTRGG